MSKHDQADFGGSVKDLLSPEFREKVAKTAEKAWGKVEPHVEDAVLAAEDLVKDPRFKKAGYGAAGGIKGGTAAKALLSKGALGKLAAGTVLAAKAPLIITGAVITGVIVGTTQGENLHETIKRTSKGFGEWKKTARAKRNGLTPD